MERKVATLTVLKKEEAHGVQQENIRAAQVLKALVRTSIGPKAMAKMILTRNGSMEITNDGNSLLREIEVTHPVIKSLIELSRTQSEESGDGTTSVIILAAEILREMLPLLREKTHPVRIVAALKEAERLALALLKKNSVDISAVRKEKGGTEEEVAKMVIRQSVLTKMSSCLLPLEEVAYKAVQIVRTTSSRLSLDIKESVRVEKILGDALSIELVHGVVIQKDVLDPSMPTSIPAAKILLIDFPLEYRKGENQTVIEMRRKESFSEALQEEEAQIERVAGSIAQLGPSVLISEKGVSDLAISCLRRKGIAAVRRVKKSDLVRISLSTGAQIVSAPEEVTSRSFGAGTFERVTYSGEPYVRITQSSSSKACTVVLRGPSKDILAEIERNLQDALGTAKSLCVSSAVVPGGGAVEMALAAGLRKEDAPDAVTRRVLEGVSRALEGVPALLLGNTGCARPRAVLSQLETLHMKGGTAYGINGVTGEIEKNVVYDSAAVKEQILKSAVEGVIIILRVDGVVKQS